RSLRLKPFARSLFFLFFFFTDPPPTDIYTLSLHDALPISAQFKVKPVKDIDNRLGIIGIPEECGHEFCLHEMDGEKDFPAFDARSEEHTSELQSRFDLVCRLLLEKKKTLSQWTISIRVMKQ